MVGLTLVVVVVVGLTLVVVVTVGFTVVVLTAGKRSLSVRVTPSCPLTATIGDRVVVRTAPISAAVKTLPSASVNNVVSTLGSVVLPTFRASTLLKLPTLIVPAVLVTSTAPVLGFKVRIDPSAPITVFVLAPSGAIVVVAFVTRPAVSVITFVAAPIPLAPAKV